MVIYNSDGAERRCRATRPHKLKGARALKGRWVPGAIGEHVTDHETRGVAVPEWGGSTVTTCQRVGCVSVSTCQRVGHRHSESVGRLWQRGSMAAWQRGSGSRTQERRDMEIRARQRFFKTVSSRAT